MSDFDYDYLSAQVARTEVLEEAIQDALLAIEAGNVEVAALLLREAL